jgi:hypothetical protein
VDFWPPVGVVGPVLRYREKMLTLNSAKLGDAKATVIVPSASIKGGILVEEESGLLEHIGIDVNTSPTMYAQVGT